MLDYFQPLCHALKTSTCPKQQQWGQELPKQISKGLCHKRFGDLATWEQALTQLPEAITCQSDLSQQVCIGDDSSYCDEKQQIIKQQLQTLIPWRKGPFHVHGIHIDSEWRSDWKWQRLLPHLPQLEGKHILDVGCGNGYHCLRSYGAGAKRVIGIDPSPRFIVQFYMLKHFLGDIPVDVLPLGIEALPTQLACFDLTFSMGVFYHRRSPMDHLRELKATLKPNGQLVLETLIIEGGLGETLVPEGRYAMMNNVWFIPSAATLIRWLAKCGFKNPRLLDSNQTSLDEQRATHWMEFHSLADFLDPKDPNKTIEGHPAPLRGIFMAEA